MAKGEENLTVRVGGRDVLVPNSTVIHKYLEPYGWDCNPLKIQQIQRYISILRLWNEKVSLTAIDDVDDLLARQFGEALFAVQVYAVEKGRLADVGSGAGIPGFALKIFSPELDVLLIERNTKKAAFLREAIRFLQLGRTAVSSGDFRALLCDTPRFDFITAKALGNYPELLDWARETLKPGGSLVLWLGARDADKLGNDLRWKWEDSRPIPGSERRVLLKGTPKL